MDVDARRNRRRLQPPRRRGLSPCALLWLALAGPAAWALEVNDASQAELESLRGIGPQLSQQLLDRRREGPFTDWADLRRRVPGLGAAKARALAAQGLTVQGAALPAEPVASAAR
jgi:competence protein ComEA